MQITKKNVVLVQTLKLLPVNHPLVLRRKARHTKRMEIVNRQRSYSTRKSLDLGIPLMKQNRRVANPMRTNLYA